MLRLTDCISKCREKCSLTDRKMDIGCDLLSAAILHANKHTSQLYKDKKGLIASPVTVPGSIKNQETAVCVLAYQEINRRKTPQSTQTEMATLSKGLTEAYSDQAARRISEGFSPRCVENVRDALLALELDPTRVQGFGARSRRSPGFEIERYFAASRIPIPGACSVKSIFVNVSPCRARILTRNEKVM